ncbi:Glucose-methanol-choline (GMC) oxidoreductase:NAD binding site [Tenacibaculum sp. 190524A02b]|uniref:GMC family oxidoreductase n=1 Tax=Tenacibaculum vairaonense TaxID=3137860 RepID=UPI0032B28481
MKEQFDYVIVGGGVAAATVAKGLLENKHDTSILILEAGPEIIAKDRRFWWDYITRGERPYTFTYDQKFEADSTGNIDYQTDGVRVKAYGGSTMHWGAWCLRFRPEDFNLYTNTGEGADWPINYEDLEPFYNDAEAFLSVCGDSEAGWIPRSKPYTVPPFEWTAADGEMIKAWEQLDVVYQEGDIDPGTKSKIKSGKMPIARYRKCMTTGTCKYCPIGGRFNAQYVLDDLKNDPRFVNFEVRVNSPVHQVNAKSKSQIESVTYTDNLSGEQKIVYGDTIILASGAYNVPKLLMASKNDFWNNGIGNDNDLVGRYVVSHSMLNVVGKAKSNPNGWFQEYDFPTLMSHSYNTKEHQKKGKIFMFKDRTTPNVDIAQLMIEGKTREEIDEIVYGEMTVRLQAFLEEKGKHSNRLQAKPGVDRFGLPQTTVHFSRTDEEMKNANDRLKLLEQILEKMGLEIVTSKVDKPGGHHTTGTARMGTSPENSVTNRDMKVHETENLYVCSNAAFPTGSAVNPTLTLTAMAFRLVKHLINKNKKTTTTEHDNAYVRI